jgi:hypothetical protein
MLAERLYGQYHGLIKTLRLHFNGVTDAACIDIRNNALRHCGGKSNIGRSSVIHCLTDRMYVTQSGLSFYVAHRAPCY